MVQKNVNLVSLGKKIRGIREDQGYSQDGFALEAGLDRTYYAGIERGERNPAALNIIKIAKTLGVEVGDLFPKIRALKKS